MPVSASLFCIGHRGAMGHAPENTLASIRKALELGAPCIEVDVYWVDGELIVFHDERLERTTNGVGTISEQTFAHLRTLDAGGGERIPTLKEVCMVIQDRACLNVELKGSGTAAPVAALISNLIKNGWTHDAFLVSSFNHRELMTIKQIDRRIPLGVLVSKLPVDGARFANKIEAFSVHPSMELLDRQFVEDCHSKDLKVYAYTVNHPEDIMRMHGLGVDGVFTNFPDRVLALFPQKYQQRCFGRRQCLPGQ